MFCTLDTLHVDIQAQFACATHFAHRCMFCTRALAHMVTCSAHWHTDTLCTWSHAHVLHEEIFCSWMHGRFAHRHHLHMDTPQVCKKNIYFARERFCPAHSAIAEWDAGGRGAARRWPGAQGAARAGRKLQVPARGHLEPTRGGADWPRPAGGAVPAQVQAQVPSVPVAGRRNRGAREPAAWSPAPRTAASWATWVCAGLGERGAGCGDRRAPLAAFARSGDAPGSEVSPGASDWAWVGGPCP